MNSLTFNAETRPIGERESRNELPCEHKPGLGGALARLLTVSALILVATACGSTDSTDPNDAFTEGVVIPGATTALTVKSNTVSRDYLLHDVQSVSTNKTPIPLVILLHGSGMTAADMRQISGMDSLADVRRFLVAYPQGSGSPSDWNAGECCGDAFSSGTDDIAFIQAVIADVSARLKVDSKRIYVGGFSDGARMTYRIACEMSTQIAAVAAVSGSLVKTKCAPTRKMPVIAFHGTADGSVFYDEPSASAFPNTGPTGAAALPPAVHFWMSSATCKTIAALQFTATTTRDTGAGCVTDVVFYSINGGTHAWPVAGAGFNFSASPLIVDFFKTHALP